MARPIILPLGRLAEHVPAHPERTTTRATSLAWDAQVEVKEWPSRGAMITAVRMARSGTNPYSLRPWDRADTLTGEG